MPSGEFISPKFDANVYTNAVAQRVPDIGDAAVKVSGAHAVLIKDVAQPARVALSGRAASPGLFDVIAVLGRARALIRLKAAAERAL